MEFTQPATLLLALALVIILGKFAEFLFRKISIPDALILISIGILIGPFGLGWFTGISPIIISIFTNFTLLFLLFDGALGMNFDSIVKGFAKGSFLTIFNYVISVVLITIIMYLFGFELLLSLLVGFMLGGISSSFVIPLLKQIKVDQETYSQLTFESAMTDVLCIVSSLTLMNVMTLDTFSTRQTAMSLMTSISVAFFVGTIAAMIWLFIESKVFNSKSDYMLTMSVLILTSISTDYFGGHGALSALFFGLVLKNSKFITNMYMGLTSKEVKEKRKAIKGQLGVNALKPSEQLFYNQLSFFLKTVFFIYIGTLIDFSNCQYMIISAVVVIALLTGRLLSFFATRQQKSFDRRVVSSLIGRGLAAAALLQVAINMGIAGVDSVADIVNLVIAGSILASCLKLFVIIWHEKIRRNSIGAPKVVVDPKSNISKSKKA